MRHGVDDLAVVATDYMGLTYCEMPAEKGEDAVSRTAPDYARCRIAGRSTEQRQQTTAGATTSPTSTLNMEETFKHRHNIVVKQQAIKSLAFFSVCDRGALAHAGKKNYLARMRAKSMRMATVRDI